MQKKINRIILIIMAVLFLLNLAVAGFFLMSSASAATTSTALTTNPDPQQCSPCPPTKKVRVQVPIPGLVACYCDVTEWMVGADGRGQMVKKRLYYNDELPQFAKNFYNLSVGIISVLAVVMIMVGGLQWIFAAGNMGKVTSARQTIGAAVTGLVLALTSYAILWNINPRLVNLSLPGVSTVQKIDQPVTWCNQVPSRDNTGKAFYICKENGSSCIINEDAKKDPRYNLCGTKYLWGFFESGKLKSTTQAGDNFCYGAGGCPDGEACFVESSIPYCENPEKKCESMDVNSCDVINDMIGASTSNKEFLNKICVKRINNLGVPDQCIWSDRIYCPEGTTRVGCVNDGPEYKEVDGKKIGCWERKNIAVPITIDHSGSKYVCTNESAGINANLVCCVSPASTGDTTPKLYGGSIRSPYILPDCTKITSCAIGANGYKSEDAKSADPCEVCNQ